MNELLVSDEVLGLFEGDEYISLINTAKEFTRKKSKGADTEEEIFKVASSPALYNRCVIDWFNDWSREG